MRGILQFLIIMPAFLLLGQGALAQTVFINEIHYDNEGGDVGEGVEVAGPAGTDLSGWSLVLYNGNGGAAYNTLSLTGTLNNQQGGYGTAFFAASGLQNGSPDGIALVNASGEVVQFLSYEGTFTAVGGPADGLLSEDIGVEETGSTPVGQSLQLTGEGTDYGQFSWTAPMGSTYNAPNTGQTFTGGGEEEPGDGGEQPEDPEEPAQSIVFINEIHYDNAGSDTNEGVEVAGTAGTDLFRYSLIAYNGNNGQVYNTINLSGVLPDQDNGFGTLFFPVAGLQNGSPDGIALVQNETGEVIQFLSYEGNFTAVGGAADGLLSEDIGVVEEGDTPVGYSLQLTGTGSNYADFSWEGPMPATFNQVNSGQSFGGEVVNPEPVAVTIAEARSLPLGTEVIVSGVLTVTNQHGGPAFMQDATGGIAVFDPQLHANEALQIGDSILVTARTGAFNNQVQLVDVSEFENFGQASEAVEAREVSIEEVAALEGQLVTIRAGFVAPNGLLFPNSNYLVRDNSGTTEVRIDDNVESLIGRQVPDGEVAITGVVGSFRGTPQILPRFLADLPAALPYEAAGDTIPARRTLDVATWNMEFFGAEVPNFGPANIQLQMENAARVIEALNADIIAVQEVSSDSLLLVLANRLEGSWAINCSDVYSYSFQPADPGFPAQKLCYLYNTEVIEVLEERVVFEDFYTQVRTSGDESLLPGYPASVSSFWASGRLPYQLTVNATVEGVSEKIHLFNIHGISNSGGLRSYQRRLYDAQVLKDTLDTYYVNENIIILGDYNDDVDEPVAAEVSSDFSPYEIFVEDSAYFVTTLSLSEAGFRSYVFQDNMIDHIAISDELYREWIRGSETTFIPFNVVENYSGTTSDHLPVKVRFELAEPLVLAINGDQQVFYGYTPEECTTLSATVSGGKGGYTYLWSTGQTSPTIEVCPSQTQLYTLTVKDEAGQSITEEFHVCVTDVSCGNFFGKKKVELCQYVGRNRHQINLCIPESLAGFFLQRGAVLGSCGEQNSCEPQDEESISIARYSQKGDKEEKFLSIDEEITVLQDFGSNRTEISFIVLEDGNSELKLYNSQGQLLKTLYKGKDTFGTSRSLQLPAGSYQPGMYFLQLKTNSGAVFNKKIQL